MTIEQAFFETAKVSPSVVDNLEGRLFYQEAEFPEDEDPTYPYGVIEPVISTPVIDRIHPVNTRTRVTVQVYADSKYTVPEVTTAIKKEIGWIRGALGSLTDVVCRPAATLSHGSADGIYHYSFDVLIEFKENE